MNIDFLLKSWYNLESLVHLEVKNMNMITKEKWAEIKLDWERYGGEYIGVLFIIVLIVSLFWFFMINPAIEGAHKEELTSLKTQILQKIVNNSATLEFSNENEAKRTELNLKEISRKDNIHFKDIKLSRKGEKFEIKVQFKSAK